MRTTSEPPIAMPPSAARVRVPTRHNNCFERICFDSRQFICMPASAPALGRCVRAQRMEFVCAHCRHACRFQCRDQLGLAREILVGGQTPATNGYSQGLPTACRLAAYVGKYRLPSRSLHRTARIALSPLVSGDATVLAAHSGGGPQCAGSAGTVPRPRSRVFRNCAPVRQRAAVPATNRGA
jgi:hypothetical protein